MGSLVCNQIVHGAWGSPPPPFSGADVGKAHVCLGEALLGGTQESAPREDCRPAWPKGAPQEPALLLLCESPVLDKS